MNSNLAIAWAVFIGISAATAADPLLAPQQFRQEIARSFTTSAGLPNGAVQLIDAGADGALRAFATGHWYLLRGERWEEIMNLKPGDNEFTFADANGQAVHVSLPWARVRQIIRGGDEIFLATLDDPFVLRDGKLSSLNWPSRFRVAQIALSPEKVLFLASDAGLFQRTARGWERLEILDAGGRAWGARDVLGVAFDSKGQLWFGSKAGVGCRTESGWRFYEGKDGLPWNDFTGLTAGADGEMWFGTHLGAIRFDGRQWHYRQGRTWLPHDDVVQIAIDRKTNVWFATMGGIGLLERRAMTLSQKADFYEEEIERYIKRTPFGYVAEAHLRQLAEKSSADPQDSDNDGLWTAMYGAGECFAYAATGQPQAHQRAQKAFEALRFLQTVTQGGAPSPPPGYIARTIRPADGPDPNAGRLERDREEQKHDKLWKVYEPRWPKSADAKWFWKSDTSSDELDGHYFFYAQYFELCAENAEEKRRVADVVRGVTDHLLTHDLVLIDHDGKPTRWAIYGPQFLNRDPDWWPERGLNSLSILSYLAVAAHITGDEKYAAGSRRLIEEHGYAHNAMYPKVQQGPGSGNQSDDEMAFMCYYNLLRYSKDEELKRMIRFSFFRYWLNEAPEMNPFFNFAYAALNSQATGANPWTTFSFQPVGSWLEDSMATLRGFPLDRLNWAHHNSHRLDLITLPGLGSQDIASPDRRRRGRRVNGKVLPVENRHFNHWNTDPWQLDYGGNGDELAAGTVFLLPYYLGLYHGLIKKPRL